jgi:hypothetical protein
MRQKKSSGRVLLIHFLEVVLMFKSSVVLSLVESVKKKKEDNKRSCSKNFKKMRQEKDFPFFEGLLSTTRGVVY